MDSGSDTTKKVNLEDLPKNELITRCKNLLIIAQKAKQAKDALQEEVNKLNTEVANNASQDVKAEIIESLTQKNLSLEMKIEDFKHKNVLLESKLDASDRKYKNVESTVNSLENENISLKHQCNRVTEENEQLHSDLESLEEQFNKLKQLGTEQQEQLLALEKSKLEFCNREHEDNFSNEMNSVKDLTTQNGILNEEIEKLKKNSEEQEYTIKTLQDANTRLREKLKLYHTKLIKFAINVKGLKEEKNEIINMFKSYTDQVKEWKEQLRVADIKIVNVLENENSDINNLKMAKQEITAKLNLCEEKCSVLLEEKAKHEEDITSLTKKVNILQEEILQYNNNLIFVTEERDHALTLLQNTTEKQKIELEDLKNNLNLYQDQVEKLKGELQTSTEENCELKQARLLLENDLDKNKNEISGINELLQVQEIKVNNLQEELNESNKEIAKLLQKSDILKTANHELDAKLNLSEEKQSVLMQEKAELDKVIIGLTENINILKEELSVFNKNTISTTEEKDRTLSLLKDATATIAKQKIEIKDLEHNLNMYQDQIENLREDLSRSTKENCEIKQAHLLLENALEDTGKETSRMNELLKVQETKISGLQDEVTKSQLLEKQFAEKSSEEIRKLLNENKDLIEDVTKLKFEIEKIQNLTKEKTNCETQTGASRFSKDIKGQTNNLQRENSEILGEMNEMNQALKERGETISKLEAHCEEIKKKLQFYEMQANKNVDSITEKEHTIKSLTQELKSLKCNTNIVECTPSNENQDEITSLKMELEHLKEKLNASCDTSYSECDAMSTSTISKVEEGSRLKDLDSSWEERYGKLRNLAVKLKGKIREQANVISTMQLEKEEIQKKLVNSVKSLQTLQSEFDKQQDNLESCNKEKKDYLNKLNKVGEQVSKDKQLLVSYEETIAKLEKNVKDLKDKKQSTESWKKQVSAKVQTLRKELEAQNLIKKELDSKITKLTSDLELKETELKQEVESHKQTKNLLDRCSSECKKNSVLNLEMQDYERSIKDLSQKLDKKNDEIEGLQTQLESQKSTANVLREQNKILEERLQNEELNFTETSQEANAYKKKIVELEDIIQQKEEKAANMMHQLENIRSQNEELSTELSKLITEHQKTMNTLQSEKDHFRRQVLGLQQTLRDVQEALKLKEDEIKIVQNKYEEYKIRAQSVLRQNQNRNVGLEEKLLEEVTTLKTQNNSVANEMTELSKKVQSLETENGALSKEKENYMKKCEELENNIKELKSQYSVLSANHQKTLSEHAETVRSLKVHADTLSQCYRQQISEQEVRHNREIIELQSRVEKAPSPTEFLPAPPITLREEGEGSESIEGPSQNLHPVPLERLLLSDMDQKVDYMKKQLAEQESKVAHLTALLSDTEQDLVKHVQMNKMLKEEIRRQQRSVEREEHAENLEYLKNVIFKFITLNGGDERARLVPVLNTILKLSPEETHKLNLVAKAETGVKGWGNYLPLWSSPSKPQ